MRICRICRQLGLNLQIEPNIRVARKKSDALTAPNTPNEAWSMDLVVGQLTDGCRIQLITVIEEFNREVLGFEVDLSVSAAQVIRCLDQIIERRGAPTFIRCDYGLQNFGAGLVDWGMKRAIKFVYSQPRNPRQSADVAGSNPTASLYRLAHHQFDTVTAAREFATNLLRSRDQE